MRSLKEAKDIQHRLRQIADRPASALSRARIEDDESPDGLRKVQAQIDELAAAIALIATKLDDAESGRLRYG